MKRDRLFSGFWAFVLSFCIAFSGCACVYTAFHFRTEELPMLAAFCAVYALLAAVCSSFRRGGGILLVLTLGLCAWLWQEGPLSDHTEKLVQTISILYDKGYGWGVPPRWSHGNLSTSILLAMCALGVPVMLGVCRTICRQKSIFWALIPGLLPLLSCLVLLDTVPQSWCLLMLITALALLGLTHSVRRLDIRDGNRLTALLLVPVMAASCLLFILIPPEGNAPHRLVPQALQDWVASLTAQGPGSRPGPLPDVGSGLAVDLSALTAREESDEIVLTVRTQYTGDVYLRGRAYEVYSGTGWSQSPASSAPDGLWPTELGSRRSTIRVTTVQPHNILYFPYYAGGDHWIPDQMVNGALQNPEQLNTYTFDQYYWAGFSGEDPERFMTCLQLPDSTKDEALAFLQGNRIDPGAEPAQVVSAIAELVRSTARYDKTPSPYQQGDGDFALWFLKEAEQGYCVHYATAATVLLRAAGIPARYVTGYAARVRQGMSTGLTSEQSHAWVEYFEIGYGWKPLEVTPGMSLELPPEPTDEPTEPPTEPPTQPPTEEPTEPPTDEPTEPTNPPTSPTNPNNPTNPTNPNTPTEPGFRLDFSWLWPVLLWILRLMGVAAVILGQYALRIFLRRRSLGRGTAQQQIFRLWREACRQAWIANLAPPRHLRRLAEKARFHAEALTEEDRAAFHEWLSQLKQIRDRAPVVKKWALRLIFALE